MAKDDLDRSLSRISRALQGTRRAAVSSPPSLGLTPSTFRMVGGASVAVAIALVSAGLLMGVPFLVALGLICLGLSGISFGQARDRSRARSGLPAAAEIGMGATVASDAVVEPGAVVEMGATIGTGAIVRRGAVVRMGATIGPKAVVEEDAVVSWGAEVDAGGVVGARSIVGAGSDVTEGARVPPDTRLRPGSTFAGRAGAESTALTAPAQAGRDPAEERIAAVCDRLEAELRASPERVREFLGASDATVAALRRTCEDLMRREGALRAEADPADLARLDEEKRVLEARIASQQDEAIRRSLQGAVAAIDEQRRQRELFRLGADRLQAEQTRLVYTLEGLASQFVRLRTAGDEAGRAPDVELERGVTELRGEIDAIADALEQVARDAPQATGGQRQQT
jgi:carbonic anhydrase/acetyltransferase-like protein (isoleucine patch superfamily)